MLSEQNSRRILLPGRDARSERLAGPVRGCYREYLRKPLLIFRKGVERACEVVRNKGTPPKPAVGLEAMEAAHMERRAAKAAKDGEDDEDEVGRCRLTVSKPELKARLVSALDTKT
jgi:hypothetical protein